MLIHRIIGKIKVIVFQCLHFKTFKKLGKGSFFQEKLRLDGARYIEIGDKVSVQKFSWFFAAKIDEVEPRIVVGDGSVLGNFNHIAAVHSVVIGKNVLTADRVYISDNLHRYEDIMSPIMHQGVSFKADVVIGDGSWVGENVAIIGAKIGKNCIVGANSVVTKDVPDYSVVVGSPAKVIKQFNLENKTWERAYL